MVYVNATATVLVFKTTTRFNKARTHTLRHGDRESTFPICKCCCNHDKIAFILSIWYACIAVAYTIST